MSLQIPRMPSPLSPLVRSTKAARLYQVLRSSSRPVLGPIVVVALLTHSLFGYGQERYQLYTRADDLRWPWSIAALPSGEFLITEREGRLVLLRTDGSRMVLTGTPDTYFAGQGGYFDVVLSPAFANDKTLFLSYAAGDSNANATAVFKATLEDEALVEGNTILQVKRTKDTPHHYGGRLLAIDGETLLLTTGEGFEYREEAQSLASELGKVLRFDFDGNPRGVRRTGKPESTIWTYGHRNPQGLTVNPRTGQIYLHEHGPRGGDEVNVLLAGSNYGWPAVTHGVDYSGAYVSPFRSAPGMVDPIWTWVPSIAPSGMAWYAGDDFPEWKDSLLIGALVDREVRRLKIADAEVVEEETLFAELDQRIRDVRVFDDRIFLLTDGEQGSLIEVRPLR